MDSLDLDFNPFADLVPEKSPNHARVGGKFKPKVKVQPRKRSSEEAIEEPVKAATLENLVTEEPLGNENYTNSEVILSTDQHSGFGKPIGENADIFLGLEYIHDFETQSPNNIEIPLPTSNVEETEQQCSFPTKNSVNSSILRACNTVGPESVVRADDGRLQLESEFQESGPFFNVERPDFLPDSINVYESCSRKFQPKPKLRNGKEKSTVTDVPQDGVGSVTPPTETQFVTSGTAYENEGLIPAFPSDEILDYSSMSFSDFIPTDATTAELPMNEEQIDVAESSRQLRKKAAGQQFVEEPEDETHHNDYDYDYDYRVDEDENDEDEEDRTEITSPKKKASKKSQTLAAKNRNPGRKRKKDNDAHEHSTSKKSQIASAKNKNPGRKRKKDNDSQEHSTQVPQKKFSHSTLRKRRLKELLDAPEDEADFQGRALKDIILLGEHKENLAVKNAKESKNASTDQRSNNSTHGEESLNEEDGVASEQDGGGAAVDQSTVLFNHNSFMDKTPRSRWSKEDTEKFYEGIRQFGTDLSMIQQLFPGKTRHQMKLKYKKEERQYPLRLSEALSSRAKDNSYFEKVIEQLNLVVEHEPNKDGSAGASDEEAELNPDTYEDAAKTEEGKEDMVGEENVGDGGGVQSPKNDEDEEVDDMDIWNSYQSVY
ncbi:Homeodomain-like superfamily protein [Euphorbia peplus]|nr:Homeodomain-like superfamily protein [Euphorbia peplus]